MNTFTSLLEKIKRNKKVVLNSNQRQQQHSGMDWVELIDTSACTGEMENTIQTHNRVCSIFDWVCVYVCMHGCINLCCCSCTCVDGVRVPLNWCECISSPKGDRDWGLRVCQGLPPILAQLWRAGFPFFFPLPNKVHPAVRADTRKKTH